MKRAFTAERLDQISVSVDAGPNSISIETHFPPKPRWSLSDRSGTVDYDLVVPQTAAISQLESANGEVLIDGMRGGSVHAHLGNGRLFSHNSFCDLEIAVTSGILTMIYQWWEEATFSVNAKLENGNASLAFPDDAAFRLRAAAPNGNISNDFAEPEARSEETLKTIDEQIGTPTGAEVQIQVTHGNIKIEEQNP